MAARLVDKLRLPLMIVAALACLATPATRYERNFPEWSFDASDTGDVNLGYECAKVAAWVSKSGKQGLGISFEIENMIPDPCPVEFTYAAFVPEGQTVKPLELPRTVDLRDEDRGNVYIPFAFDNEKLWNEGKRTGVLFLTLKIRGEVREFHLPMTHRMDGYQKLRNPNARPKQSEI